MKSISTAVLSLLSQVAYKTAVESVSSVSAKGLYQPQEPKALTEKVMTQLTKEKDA